MPVEASESRAVMRSPFDLAAIRERTPEIAAAAVALILMLSIWLGARYLSQADWVRHTLEVETRLSQVWSLLQDAEIAQRSYVLTGDEKFLAPFYSVSAGCQAALEALEKLTADNPRQVAAIVGMRPLVAERLAFAETTIATRRQGDFESARMRVVEGRGFALTEDLRQRFARMHESERQLLKVREEATQTTIGMLTAAIVLAVLCTIGALGYWIFSARRLARELTQTNSALARTIAEREAAEQQMRQMQKMEAVGQLTGGIAHDFNNMLAVIVSGIGLARRRMAKGEAGADSFLSSALEGAQRAATLVKRLLAFARQQPLAPETIDANKFVSGLSELISRALGESVRMETILGGGLWPTLADPAQLETSILNLCVNARDAMPDGGRLTLETANCHLDDRYSRLHPDVPPGQYVMIAVSDTGVGMAPDIAGKAFEPFFTTKEVGKGTGLGLSQVFGFVKQSGGHVKIYSEPGQGTTIKIYLPRHYPSAPDRSASAGSEIAEIKGSETILLVEDDTSVLALTASGLRDLGYKVLEARHAEEAIEHLAGGTRIDLMLTDIVMPDINGRKLAEQAQGRLPDLRVLFMTGFTKNAVVHNGVLDPGVNFLAKPFTLEELSRKVREVLDTKIEA